MEFDGLMRLLLLNSIDEKLLHISQYHHPDQKIVLFDY